jgi:RNA polymerase sigma-70 factor, ECF subfamily
MQFRSLAAVVIAVFAAAPLWVCASQFDPDRGTMRQFLCAISRNVAIDHLRRQTARRVRDHNHCEHRQDATFDIELGSQRNESAARVRSSLAKLPIGERDLIAAALFDHITYAPVARHFGIPEGTVKSRVRSGLRRIRFDLIDLNDAA